ncbi:MAG: radical SAM protein, partial [Candidatus Omnitrophota bacterium]|nr:radical SAM protein [Candidatus Omnitrophota bacterium]
MKYIYGPVKSRRLGLSLGISLIPYKICSFNCVYCQLGKTLHLTSERKEYTPILEAL